MRVHRSISVLLVLVATVAAVAFALSSVTADAPQLKNQAATATPASPPNQPHILYGALWRTDGAFASTIRLKNVLVVAPLQVTPTLFMADGTAYPLPSVTIPISGVATININDALAAAPQSIAPHVSQFGSATLFYTYPSPGHLLASIAAIDVPRSLSFVYPVLEPMPMPSDTSMQALEGLWWKHDGDVRGTISLSNTTDQQRTVTLREIRNAGDLSAREVQLAPHSTQMVDLEQISRDASDSRKTAGGVRVEFQGPRESIMITGSLANESIGYSANMPFWSRGMMTSTGMTAPAPPSKLSLGIAGLMIGKPDPMMMPGFPADTKFAPYLALRNTTAKPIDLVLQLNYTPMMNGATPVNRSLPVQRLHPFEAKLVDTESMLQAAGLGGFSGTINLGVSFTGEGGDLVVASGSVDQTGSYVFGVLPQWVEPSIGRTTGYWSIAKGNDAMFSLWNPSNATQDLTATIYYGDGSGAYHLPVHLAPQASTMIDIGMLIMNRVPGADGKIIPPGIEEGSVSFDSTGTDSTTSDHRKRMTVVISGGLFNIATATCGETCTYCNGYSSFTLSPGSASLVVGGSQTFTAWGVDSYGKSNEFYGGQWSTGSNGTVASVDSGGKVTGAGLGGDSVIDQLSNIEEWQGQMCVSDNMTPNCNPQNPYASASVSVAISIRLGGCSGSNITQTQTVVTGQQIQLCADYGTGVAVNSQSWSIPGTIVGGFNTAPTNGGPAPVSLAGQSTTFYWAAADTQTVTFTLKYGNNQTASATANFDILGVASPLVTTSLGNWQITSGPALEFGDPSTTPGITFSKSATPPTGYTGSYEWIQLITTSSYTCKNTRSNPVNEPTPGLDKSYPYSVAASTTDSPEVFLPSADVQVTWNFGATMYLMWRPGLTNDIYVPLGYVSWQALGDAKQNGGLWANQTDSSRTAGSFVKSSSYPQWTRTLGAITPCP